jgi:serine-type D-Ala-D-Ala carboxypeptidase (penicillin-binding protein 5/6)
MLPSGNDAANELAYWMGAHLVGGTDLKEHLKAFVSQMNKHAALLGLKHTQFANPHGLPSHNAKSNANDVAKLCCVCMKSEHFRHIVKQEYYRLTVRNGTATREVIWENTNKLLRRSGFVGIKTGITVTAGPCLAAAYEFKDKTYISVILRAPKVSARFKDTRILLHWALTRLFKQDLSESEKQQLRNLKKNNRDLDSDYSEDEHEFRYNCGDAG